MTFNVENLVSVKSKVNRHQLNEQLNQQIGVDSMLFIKCRRVCSNFHTIGSIVIILAFV